jgi:hypothetical protein
LTPTVHVLQDACRLYDESFYVSAYGDTHRDFYNRALAETHDTVTRAEVIAQVVESNGRVGAAKLYVVGC